MYKKVLIAICFILLIYCATGEARPTKNIQRILLSDVPLDGDKIYYLGKSLTKEEFKQVKEKELSEFVKDMKSLFKVDFKTRQTKYINFAYRNSEEDIKKMENYLVVFFQQVYPRYFKFLPRAAIRVTIFKDQNEFIKLTGFTSYGYYMGYDDSNKLDVQRGTFYTYSNSGYGTYWHEIIHAFVDNNIDSDPQQWFNEGFASFYEMGALYNGKVIEGYTNWRLPELQSVIKSGKFTPLSKFLKSESMSEDFGYSEARFIFCYLWAHDRIEPFVKAYIYELAPKYSGVELGEKSIEKMEELVEKKIDVIEKEYKELALKSRKNEILKKIK